MEESNPLALGAIERAVAKAELARERCAYFADAARAIPVPDGLMSRRYGKLRNLRR